MRFSYIGPQIQQLLGWDPASWVDVNDWASRMHADDREWVVPYCVAQSQAGIDHEADYRALTAGGGFVWVRDVVHVVRNESGEVESLIGFMFDISQRKKTEEQLADLQLNLESLVVERTAQLQLETDKRQRLERDVFEIAEGERRRIGRELHDDLGQRLTGISLLAQAITNDLAQHPRLADRAATVQRLASDAVSQMRSLAHGLMPEGPDAEGFRDALTRLAAESSSGGDTVCTFEFDDPIDVGSPAVASHLFRIAQEAVSNAIRHANASTIVIRLDLDGDKVVLTITDDGTGGALDRAGEAGRGRGLSIIEHRATLINFKLGIASPAGNGTRIVVKQC